MSDAIVEAWLRDAIQEADGSRFGFASAHLPDVGPGIESPSSLSGVAELIAALCRACEVLDARGATYLAMPLSHSPTLDVITPAFVPWPFNGVEPPSLYYLEPRHWNLPSDREEYRCPYTTEQLTGLPISGTYACGRSLHERANKWDFARTVWFGSPNQRPVSR